MKKTLRTDFRFRFAAGLHCDYRIAIDGVSVLRYAVSQRGPDVYGDDDGSHSRGGEGEGEGRKNTGRNGYVGIRCGPHSARPSGRREGPAVRHKGSQYHYSEGDGSGGSRSGQALQVRPRTV